MSPIFVRFPGGPPLKFFLHLCRLVDEFKKPLWKGGFHDDRTNGWNEHSARPMKVFVPMSDGKLLTPDETAKILRVSKQTIYRWVHLGFIPHHKLGGSIRFSPKSIENWLKARENTGRSTLWLEAD